LNSADDHIDFVAAIGNLSGFAVLFEALVLAMPEQTTFAAVLSCRPGERQAKAGIHCSATSDFSSSGKTLPIFEGPCPRKDGCRLFTGVTKAWPAINVLYTRCSLHTLSRE